MVTKRKTTLLVANCSILRPFMFVNLRQVGQSTEFTLEKAVYMNVNHNDCYREFNLLICPYFLYTTDTKVMMTWNLWHVKLMSNEQKI
jgi:hypothetical protein